MQQSELILILHLIALAFFVGGQFFYLFIVQPASYQFFSTNDQIRFLQNILRRQNPVLLLCLCAVVLTGGFLITPLKSALGTGYFTAFGPKLIKKLAFFFVVFFITAYQTLAVGFKIRYLDPAKDVKHLSEKLNGVRLRMTITSLLNILVTTYVIYIARNL